MKVFKKNTNKKKLLVFLFVVAVVVASLIVTDDINSATPNPGHPWSQIDNFPAACGAGSYVSAIGSTLTCGTPGSGSQWITSGSNIYYDIGHVGIGINPGTARLDVYAPTTYGVFAFSAANYGETSGDSAIYGKHGDFGNGVAGTSETGNGIYARSTSGNGIFSESLGAGNGVVGRTSSAGSGVWGDNPGSGNGLAGLANTGSGVFASSTNGNGVYGLINNNNAGVIGYNTGTGVGVRGVSPSGFGIYCEGSSCGGNKAWTNASDERLKKNITTIENALDKVENLRGVNFKWKSGLAIGKKDIGFIAQEVDMVIPEIVSKNGPNGYYTMETSQITAVLVEAMKEQQKQIENLIAQNAKQQEEIDSLKLIK